MVDCHSQHRAAGTLLCSEVGAVQKSAGFDVFPAVDMAGCHGQHYMVTPLCPCSFHVADSAGTVQGQGMPVDCLALDGLQFNLTSK
jgi:hypothetical protein